MTVLIKPRTTTAALNAVRDATATAADLEAKAADARAESARIRDANVDVLVDDPGQAGRITQEMAAQDLLANAYTVKAATERAQATTLAREALLIESEHLDKRAGTLEKDAEKHQAKVDALLAQLEDLDGVTYQVAPYSPEDRPWYHSNTDATVYPTTRAENLVAQANTYRYQASMIRYVLEHGEAPDTASVLDFRETPEHNMQFTMAGEYVHQHPDVFFAPLLSAYLAGNILDHATED